MADQDIRSTSGDKASKPEEPHESPSTSSVEATPVQQKQEEPTKGVLSRMKGLIPPWLTKNLTDPYKLKILFRCCIASWATFILIIPDRSLAALGNAAFFGCIASFIIPPMFAAQLFSMAILTIGIGIMIGWAWGCAAMRAGLTARSQPRYREALLRQQSSEAGKANLDQQFQIAIFQGVFLDPATSAIFGLFFAIACFCLALVRAYAPKLALVSVFGTIFVDVFCSYGPLFPFAEYEILNTFLISFACYAAIGLVTIATIFPESLNHQWTNQLLASLKSVNEIIQVQEKILSTPTTDREAWEGFKASNHAHRDGLVQQNQGMMGNLGMLGLEATYTRFNAEDLKGVFDPVKKVLVRASGVQVFSALIYRWTDESAKTEREHGLTEKDGDKKSSRQQASYPPGQVGVGHAHVLLRRQAMDDLEVKHSHRMDDLLPVVASATQELRSACHQSLADACDSLDKLNNTRQNTPAQLKEREDKAEENLERLRNALEEFRVTKRLEILAPYHMFSGQPIHLDGKGNPPFSMRPLFACFVYSNNLVRYTEQLIRLLQHIHDLQKKRPRSRMWMPTGLRRIGHVIFQRSSTDAELLGDKNQLETPDDEEDDLEDDETEISKDPEVEKELKPKKYKRDPDAMPSVRGGVIQSFGFFLHRTYKWLQTPEAIFATKYMLVSIALWMPQVFQNSAYFVYTNRGLWALIMGQTGLSLFMSDQLANYIGRIIGTFFGAVFGMVAWYIGNGHGTGNPYGCAAAAALVIVPAMAFRIFAPPQMMITGIMGSVTTILVLGYSWQDTHLPTLSNPGYGFEMAWRRFLLVAIGLVAGFIIMLIPPQSGRVMIRKANARVIHELSDMYATLIGSWIDHSEHDLDSTVPKAVQRRRDQRLEAFWKRIFNVAGRLQALRVSNRTAKFEISLRGKWPAATYEELANVERHMLGWLIQLGSAIRELDPKWRTRLLHRTAFLNPNLIGDTMSVFYLVSRSLKTGESMHEVLPDCLLDRVFYHHSLSPRAAVSADEGNDDMHFDVFKEEEFWTYAAAIVAVRELLADLDTLNRLVKSLVGEAPLQGFHDWRQEWEARRAEKLV